MSGSSDSMPGYGKDVYSSGDTAPLSSSNTTQPPPFPTESNRDSLNLDDFEKVEADDNMFGAPLPQVPSSDVAGSLGNVAESTQATAIGLVDDIMSKVASAGNDDLFMAHGLPEDSVQSSSLSDQLKIDERVEKETTVEESAPVTASLSFANDGIGGVLFDPLGNTSASELLPSAPPPPSSSDLLGDLSAKSDDAKTLPVGLDDFLSKGGDFGVKDSAIQDNKESLDFFVPDNLEIVKEEKEPLLEFSSPETRYEPLKREPTPEDRNPTPPRPDSSFVQDLPSDKKLISSRTPTPPPLEHKVSPSLSREATPPREPTPPRTPTPPVSEPIFTTRNITPPPVEPALKLTTPVLMEPSPQPREHSPVPSTPKPSVSDVQESTVSPGRISKLLPSTEKAFNVFRPWAWFNPDQLDPRVVDLIYWRDVKKTGIVFGSLMVILLSLAYLSLISVVAYTSLAILTGTITFRVYKNIMQAVQKSQDGHPFKALLELDTNLSSEKVHEATDVIVSQINSTVSELKRLFLVEDLVDSVKFGCLLWCLTYLGSWFNGLTLVILAVVALFSLPKVYEQNQAQFDQYVGLVRSQVNDVMSKVKAALPIGNKEKTQ